MIEYSINRPLKIRRLKIVQENSPKIPKPKRIQHRIMGAEVEHGVETKGKSFGGSAFCNSTELAKSSLPVKLCHRYITPRAILPNQAQVYSDSGNHPEYATPECWGAKETALYETAGLKIMAKAVRRYNESKPSLEKISLHKTNRNCEWTSMGLSIFSWGSHANFLSLRGVEDGQRVRDCMPFLLSRWPLIGNGWFKIVDQKYLWFIFSQRGEVMKAMAEYSTTGDKRPLINTRDHSEADTNIWRRVHDISGNSNMSQWQLFLKYGTWEIVLAMIEASNFLETIPLIAISGESYFQEFKSLTSACRIFNADLRCRFTAELLDGRQWTSLDFQRYYLNEAHRFFAEGRGTLTPERKLVMEFWTKILDALERWDLPFLARYLDWAAMLYYEIMPRVKRLGFNPELLFLDDPSLADSNGHTPVAEGIPYDFLFKRKGWEEKLIDYFLYYLVSYANVDISSSPYGFYLRTSRMERLFSEAESSLAETNPPARTRAKLREEMMQNPPHGGMETKGLGWSWITFAYSNQVATAQINLPNPYRATMRPEGERVEPVTFPSLNNTEGWGGS